MPPVNAVLIGLPGKDMFNSSKPIVNGQFGGYAANPTLPGPIEIAFNAPGIALKKVARHRLGDHISQRHQGCQSADERSSGRDAVLEHRDSGDG